ncbi:spore germination protein GerPC [Bacillus sp. EB01]|uniref:spore germination protein GerPC n=1 Tax=Bacillus sp. EB01 TaxID=1347086 RepID=UPI0005C48E7D|nr:spore germination protein GerPC [Bacillus sp. EB01]
MDLYQALQWMQGQLQVFNQRIAVLEESLRCAEEEIRLLKEKPTIQVGTIQYKFDQLKVESLEGTLSIGLNPNDLQGIEEMAIAEGQNGFPGQPGSPGDFASPGQQRFEGNPGYNPQPIQPIDPTNFMQRSTEINDAIHTYLEQELPSRLGHLQEELGLPKSDDYLSFIKSDVKKQLPGRIESHIRRASATGQEVENEMILSALKQEIENGIRTFLANLPDQLKGGSL